MGPPAPARVRDDPYPARSCASLPAIFFAEASSFGNNLLHDRITIEHADGAAPIFGALSPLGGAHQRGHQAFEGRDTLFQGFFRHRRSPAGPRQRLSDVSCDAWLW